MRLLIEADVPCGPVNTLDKALADPQVVYGVPYGVNAWDNLQPGVGPHMPDEFPAQYIANAREVTYWLNLDGPDRGLTVACTRRAMERVGGELRINMLHPLGEGGNQQTPVGDTRLTMRTRLHAHAGDWQQARAYRAGMELNAPLLGVPVSDPVTPKHLEPVASLCAGIPENVVVTAIKQAEDGQGSIVRGYEAAGQPAAASPRLVGAQGGLVEVNIVEEQPKTVSQALWQPYEIKTLRIQ